MVWYNPATWGQKSVPVDDVLRCYNPHCRRPINSGPVVYGTVVREVYHTTACAESVMTRGVEMQMGNFGNISLERALRHHKAGRLAPLVNGK